MFPLIGGLLAGTIGAGLGAGIASAFGGGQDTPSVGSTFSDINQGLKDVGVFPLNSSPFPQASATTPGGGGVRFDPGKFVNLGGKQNVIDNILAGKGKHKNLAKNNPELFKFLEEGGDPSKIPFDLFGQQNKGLKKKGKVDFDPQVHFESDPQAEALFNFARDQEFQRAQQQAQFNQMISGMIPGLAGLQGNAINSLNSLIDQGFTENSPFIQQQNAQAKDAFFQGGMADITRGFKDDAGAAIQDLVARGIVGTDMAGIFQNTVTEPFAHEVGKLAHGTQVFGRDLMDRSLANQRAAAGTLFGVPGQNAAISNLDAPRINADPLFFNPTGQFDPALVSQNAQFIDQFGLQRDQLKMSPFLEGLGLAGGQQQPSIGQNLGAIAGATLPAAISAFGMSNFANKIKG